MSNASANWLAVDWGTSSLRIWAMQDRTIVAQAKSDHGMANMTPDAYETVLREVAGPMLADELPIIICGMAGARQGWIEAAYRPVPASPMDVSLGVQPDAGGLNVVILNGMSQNDPPDVMRGEETQIAGVLLQEPKFDGVICLPGTHTKWARISAEEVCHFMTAMTGEIFALLSEKSVLRHGLPVSGHVDTAFLEAVDAAYTRPQRIASQLFGIRAAGLLAETDPAAARSRLSGYLIGMELAAAKPYWLGAHVALVGPEEMCDRYLAALESLGASATKRDATDATLDGLYSARLQILGNHRP